MLQLQDISNEEKVKAIRSHFKTFKYQAIKDAWLKHILPDLECKVLHEHIIPISWNDQELINGAFVESIQA